MPGVILLMISAVTAAFLAGIHVGGGLGAIWAVISVLNLLAAGLILSNLIRNR